jgi:hypothetical protein
MSNSDREEKYRRLVLLRQEMQQLEQDMIHNEKPRWQPSGYYTAYFATSGFLLGGVGAAASLLFNIIGSLIVGQHPLQIIKVYLTFPLGARALDPELDSGMVLAVGCCLYLATGMLLGVPVYLLLTKFTQNVSTAKRLAIASAIGVVVWLINFYGVLSWLQPLLFGGDWIVTSIPPWVALLTHLVFAWTMALLYPLGLYQLFPKNSSSVSTSVE